MAAARARAKNQLHARMVFDEDSVTNVAHQLGFFDTIASVDTVRQLPGRIAATTVDDVNAAAAAMFRPANRTIGRFEPLAVGSGSGNEAERR